MSSWLRTTLARLPSKHSKRRTIAERVADYLAQHQHDFGAPGSGTCPVCGHHGCFGRMSSDPDRWYCFSAGHEAVCGADGKPVGRRGNKGFLGDVLDLHAYAAGRSRSDQLRANRPAPSTSSRTAQSPEPEWSQHELHELYQERLAVRILDGGVPEPVACVLARADALKAAALRDWPAAENSHRSFSTCRVAGYASSSPAQRPVTQEQLP